VGSNCVDCVRAAKPATATRARNWSARQPLLVTKSLMAINIAIFVWVIVQNPSSLMSRGITKGQAQLGLSADIIDRGVIFQFADGAYLAGPGEWYRIITSGFIHFGLIHIAFNMYLLYLLGQMIEPAIGRLRFTLLYFASLIGGSAGAMILQPGGFHGGASGAVFGLMGAAFIGYRQRGVNPFATGIGTLLLLNLFITFALPGISIGGHLGGVAVGALVGSVVLAPNQRRYPSWFPTAFPAVIIMVGIAVTAVAVAAR
jgi:membrane associated rhomboid family serine protease